MIICSVKNETALGQWMHDFQCTDADDMHYRLLADRVRYFKEDKEGVEFMCRAMNALLIPEEEQIKYSKML